MQKAPALEWLKFKFKQRSKKHENIAFMKTLEDRVMDGLGKIYINKEDLSL